MTKLWNIIGQKPTYEMQSQSPETLILTCLSDEVPNLQKERDIATEVPISMNVSLPPCWVVLRQLTEEEIHQRYPDPYCNEQNNTDLSSDSRDSFFTAFEKDCKRRRLRDFNKSYDSIYDLYKKRRQQFIRRHRSIPESFDDSSDMSQDEFKNSGKGKKRGKRVKKYERDSEWSPYTEKNIASPYGKRLRRQVRRAVIESDTSSTDEEDLLAAYYNMYDYSSDQHISNDAAFQNPVPSETSNNDPGVSSKSDIKGTDGKALSETCPNSSQSAGVNACAASASNHDSDILSGIMKEMDACKPGSGTIKASHTLKPTPLRGNTKPKLQRGKKRFKLSNASESGINSVIITNVIQEMVNTVCMQHKQFEIGKKKFYKKCKWCHTQFPTGNANVVMCAICNDLGKGKYLCSTLNKNNNQTVKEKPTKIKKQSTGNKVGKKVNNTMSRVLKILPKNEMQRLMYSEKNGKTSNEKGYNHCKTLLSANSEIANEALKIPLEGNDLQFRNSSETLNSEIKDQKISGSKGVKKSISTKKRTTSVVKSASPKCKKGNKPVDCDDITKNRNKISLKKFDNGLFLINFPEPGGELNLGNPDTKSATVEKDEIGKSSRYNGSRATKSPENAISSNETKTSTQTAKDDQYQSYLLPPIPTVLIANYSSNSDNGNYRLSSIFYQNEYTQQHSVNIGARSPNMAVPPVLPSSSSSNQIIPPAPNILNNNSPLTITTISLDERINQIQSFMKNDSPVINTMPSSLTNIPLLPVVNSVVSLRGKKIDRVSSEDEDLFTDDNFVNSEQLQIKITSVACNQALIEDTNSMGKGENSSDLHNIEAFTKSQNSDAAAKNKLQNKSSMVLKSVSLNLDSSKSLEGQRSNINGQTEDTNHDISEKPPSKPKDAINSAIDLLGAISILAVIDLDKSPRAGLNIQIQMAKSQLAKLNSEKNAGSDHSAKIASCQYNLELLDTANKFLNLYGSFAKVSDFLLRKHRMIQIKKEMLDEEEEDEEGNHSSCRFSQKSQSTSSLNNQDLSTPSLSSVATKIDYLQASINHIEKLQSQIAAMNNTQLTMNNAHLSQYDIPNSSTIHHFATEQYAALTPTIGAPAPVTPRNEYMGGESRETPSRGSGPRTPARPESATSQPDEQAITAQIKKELMEVTTSLPSQCAYSQNTTLTQMQAMQDFSSLNVGHSISNNIVQQIVGNDSGNKMYQSRPPPTYNQSYSNVLLNITPKPQVSPNVRLNSVDQNGQLLIGQQLYIPNATGLPQKQAVPSVNNQYLIQPPFSNSNTGGGTALVNSCHARNQNVNALLTNVSNQQFYTSNQVPQVYYPPQPQLTTMTSSIPTPTLTVVQNQQTAVETKEQMYCAVCKNLATLRCKQCAKVAYCNTACAKTYWHQKHKMECKPLPS